MKITLSLVAFVVIALFSSCGQEKPQASSMETTTIKEVVTPGFIHTVFFWMKEETTADQRTFFEEGLRKLSKISSIQNVYWGPPAPSEARDVVDNSYDYAFIVHFKSIKEHDQYQEDQIHLDFIEASKDFWEKVQVYDNVVKK